VNFKSSCKNNLSAFALPFSTPVYKIAKEGTWSLPELPWKGTCPESAKLLFSTLKS
jgi:hypothetical protein